MPEKRQGSSPSSEGSAPSILVADQDNVVQEDCRRTLAAQGYAVEVAESARQALRRLQTERFDLALVDVQMPGLGGLDFLDSLRELDPALVCIVIIGCATVETAVEATRRGACDLLTKPFSSDDLLVKVARGLEQRRLLLEARRLRSEAQQLEAMKARFISMVVHEIRAPLSAIRAHLERFNAGSPLASEGHREALAASVERIDSLLSLTNDLLDLSRVQAGELAREVVPLDLGALLHGIACLQGGEALARGIAVEEAMPPDLPSVEADKEDLVRLFTNLVNNAIKYNRPGGRVWVRATAESDAVRVEVGDTGLGIPPEHLPHVFDDFYRVPTAHTPGILGSGLGLAVVKRIAEAYGATVTVESRPGEGTTFTVRLPREYRPPAPRRRLSF